MRQAVLILALVCALPATPEVARAQAMQADASLDRCVAAAGASEVALQACRGSVSEPCVEQPGGETTAGSVRCFDAEAQAWGALLDAAVARAARDASRASYLSSAQEAWRAWRQAECRYQASMYEGGSLARVISSSCSADLTANRAIALILAERTQPE
jgi:uncharacterized protein YecT (DUF1311 family)